MKNELGSWPAARFSIAVTRWFFTVCWIFVGSCALGASLNAGTEALFTLEDPFGVDYPDQIVELQTIRATKLGRGASGQPTQLGCYQVLRGGEAILLRSNLRRGESKKWAVRDLGASRSDCGEVVHVESDHDFLTISNSQIAVRIPSQEALSDSLQMGSGQLAFLTDINNLGNDQPRAAALAPVQGLRLADGQWTALGPNALLARAQALTAATVTIDEQGPLRASVTVRYEFNKQAYSYGAQRISDPGVGFLNVRISLCVGHPVLIFEEETDLDEVWALNAFDHLAPNHASYYGYRASNAHFGHNKDGSIYAPSEQRSHLRDEPDAIVDIDYGRPRGPGYTATDNSWAILPIWNPWSVDTGWYWQLYNSANGDDGNVVAIFAGEASRALGAGFSGAAFFSAPRDAREPKRPVAGISSQSYRRAPDGRIYQTSRFSWGIFVGQKGRDLAGIGKPPTVNIEANLFAGTLSLSKLSSMRLGLPIGQGSAGLFMDGATLESVIDRLRKTRVLTSDYYTWLYNADPYSQPLIDSWVDETGAKMCELAKKIIATATELADEMVNGKGVYSFRFHYWHGGLELRRLGLWIDQTLASPYLIEAEKTKVRAAAQLFGYVLWDNDFVPMDNSEGINLGTANMPVQQANHRDFFALLLASNPDFSKRAAQVQKNIIERTEKQINDSGAHFGAPHYIAAAFAPTLNTLMQIKQLGLGDPFATEPKLTKFADFYLNLLTPPEIRFPGKPRSLIALGDSSTETSPIFGQLGTAFRDANSDLSKALMWAWNAGGSPHSFFFGTTIMSIDDRLPARAPRLGSASFPGYYSVLRSGWNSPDETAVWIVDGDFYSDHRANDAGSVVIYALGAPVSVHWGSIYYPRVAGRYYQSTVTLGSQLGRAWNEDAPRFDVGNSNIWKASGSPNCSFGKALESCSSNFVSAGLQWRRTIMLDHADAQSPIIVIKDKFDGEGAAQAKISTLNLMADGPVHSSFGSIIPEKRTHPAKSETDSPKEHASVGKPFALIADVTTLSFKGQYGVDFDVCIPGDVGQQGSIGNWADVWTQQSVPNWEERQDILRIHGTESFLEVLIPYRSGRRPKFLQCAIEGDHVAVYIDHNKRMVIP